jgi:hypothetical protein
VLDTLVSNVLLGVGLGSQLNDVASVVVSSADEGAAYDGVPGADDDDDDASTGQEDAVASVEVAPIEVGEDGEGV